MENAKKKLLEQSKNSDAAIKKVVEYLIGFLDEPFANKILNENKSVDKMWSYVRGQAKKKAVQGCACIEDNEVFSWAVHYFDEDNLEDIQSEEPVKKIEIKSKTEPKKKQVQKVEQLSFEI